MNNWDRFCVIAGIVIMFAICFGTSAISDDGIVHYREYPVPQTNPLRFQNTTTLTNALPLKVVYLHYRLGRFTGDATGRLYAYETELDAKTALKKSTKGTQVLSYMLLPSTPGRH